MTLLDKFDDALEHSTPVRFAFRCEQIAEDFAIGFADWRNSLYVATDYKNLSTKELLEIYKKEQKL